MGTEQRKTAFDGNAELAAPLERDQRIDIELAARLLHDKGLIDDITIENLSIWGLQASCQFPPTKGDAVVVTIEGLGDFEGVVRWQRNYQFGMHTFEKIDINAISKS